MSAESGGRKDEGVERSDWLLRCEGMRVQGPGGFAGQVVAPVYGPSVRWDRPWAFLVRTDEGFVRVPRGAIEHVDMAARVISLREAIGP